MDFCLILRWQQTDRDKSIQRQCSPGIGAEIDIGCQVNWNDEVMTEHCFLQVGLIDGCHDNKHTHTHAPFSRDDNVICQIIDICFAIIVN